MVVWVNWVMVRYFCVGVWLMVRNGAGGSVLDDSGGEILGGGVVVGGGGIVAVRGVVDGGGRGVVNGGDGVVYGGIVGDAESGIFEF